MRRARLALGLALGLCIAGCDAEPPPPAQAGPTVQIRGVRVTVGYDEAARPIRAELAEGALLDGVRPTTSVEIDVDRFLDPNSVTRQAICLRPATGEVHNLDECTDPAPVFLEPTYSPVERRVRYYLPAGAALAPSTYYRLTVYPATRLSDYGLRAFDGPSVDRRYELELRTGPSATDDASEQPPSPEAYCQAQGCVAQCRSGTTSEEAARECIARSCRCLDDECLADGDVTSSSAGLFAQSCTGSGCHSGGNPGAGVPWGGGDAAMGLDLATVDAIEQTAIGQVAHQTEVGERGSASELTAARFGRSMPIVRPSSPAHSYLVYKALIQTMSHAPSDQLDPDVGDELERLRAAWVIGAPMPPADSLLGVANDPLGKGSWRRLRLLDSWVSHGAVTRCP